MVRSHLLVFAAAGTLALAAAVGCGQPSAEKARTDAPLATDGANNEVPGDETAENLAKLSPEDRELALAQKVCPVSNEALGSMGVPYKMMVGDKPVFLCCDGCKPEVEKDPEAILAKLAK